MTCVLAVDPGVATGWAFWWGGILAYGTDDQQTFCDRAWQYAINSPLEDDGVIVCESFVITPNTLKMSFQPASLEIIGMLRWVAHVHDLKFVLQKPAEKRFMPDSKLRSLGWWVRGSAGHDNDALRHLGIYLAKHEHNTEVLRAK